MRDIVRNEVNACRPFGFRREKFFNPSLKHSPPDIHPELYLPHNTVEAVLEPLDGLTRSDLVGGTDLGLAAAALGDVLTGTGPIKVSLLITS